MIIESYRPEAHLDGCRRIWKEVGWLPGTPGGLVCMERFFLDNPCVVAEQDGQAEAQAVSVTGTLRHMESRLPLLVVASVTVGRTGRKRGLGTALTAEATARGADEGCAVAALGFFEQGYYNRLGYGNGPYNRIATFRPSDLSHELPYPARPCRIGADNLDEVYGNLCVRMRCHGQAILSRSFYQAELDWDDKVFGLGCKNGAGELTHHVWFNDVAGDHGPYRVGWMSYPDTGGLLELLGLIRSLEDQVDLIVTEEPPHIQIQDLLRHPIRNSRITAAGRDRAGIRSLCYTQLRILDPAAAMELTSIPWGEAAFNLTLTDPITGFLQDRKGWTGCAGDYTVKLGSRCSAVRGHARGLPMMTAGIGAFSRLWLGVRKPSVLAVTDDLNAPEELLRKLDDLLPLPEPRFNCDF
jgi:predicted acetyltransferase